MSLIFSIIFLNNIPISFFLSNIRKDRYLMMNNSPSQLSFLLYDQRKHFVDIQKQFH